MYNANPQHNVNPDFAAIGVIIPSAVHELLGTSRRWRAYQMWNHSIMMRHQPEAAKLLNSPQKVADLMVEAGSASDRHVEGRARELLAEYTTSSCVRTVDGVEVRRFREDKTSVRIKDGKPVA